MRNIKLGETLFHRGKADVVAPAFLHIEEHLDFAVETTGHLHVGHAVNLFEAAFDDGLGDLL